MERGGQGGKAGADAAAKRAANWGERLKRINTLRAALDSNRHPLGIIPAVFTCKSNAPQPCPVRMTCKARMYQVDKVGGFGGEGNKSWLIGNRWKKSRKVGVVIFRRWST